jgi:hypothetical protein
MFGDGNPDHTRRLGISKVTPQSAEAIARALARDVNALRVREGKPREDHDWVLDYYRAFFFDYTPIYYSQLDAECFMDFPAVARARVRAQRWSGKRPPTSWWFGEDPDRPQVEIIDIDVQGRFVTARLVHWRRWGETSATGGDITCQIALVERAERVEARITRYWHAWVKATTDDARFREVSSIFDGLRERAAPQTLLAPLRNDNSHGVCLFGANASERTHLLVASLQDHRPVFIGRFAAYPFETLLHISLRCALHFPFCLAEVSERAGTTFEVQGLVGIGKIVAGLHPRSGPATAFLEDLATHNENFALFGYDWPSGGREPSAVHLDSFRASAVAAMAWGRARADGVGQRLRSVLPQRTFEQMLPGDAVRFAGTCVCPQTSQ